MSNYELRPENHPLLQHFVNAFCTIRTDFHNVAIYSHGPCMVPHKPHALLDQRKLVEYATSPYISRPLAEAMSALAEAMNKIRKTTPSARTEKRATLAGTLRNVKTRTALLVAVVGLGIFVVAGIAYRNGRLQTPGTSFPVRGTHYMEPKSEVNPEPMLPADPAATRRAIDAELNRAMKRAIDVEVNRTIGRALSDANDNHLKDHNY